MPLKGVHGRLYSWCAVCQKDRPTEHPSLSTHLSRAHQLDLIPGCPRCTYFRGRWSDVKKHARCVHQLDIEAANEVVWGLTLKDKTKTKPSYANLEEDSVCLYPLREESLSSLQSKIIGLGHSSAAPEPHVPETRSKRRRPKQVDNPPVESPPRKVRTSRRVVLASPRRTSTPEPVTPSTSTPEKASVPSICVIPQDQPAVSPHVRKQKSPKSRRRSLEATVSMLSASTSADFTWDTVSTPEYVVSIPVLDAEAEPVELDETSVVTTSRTQETGCQTTVSTRDMAVQAAPIMCSREGQTYIMARPGDVIVVVPQRGGRLSLH